MADLIPFFDIGLDFDGELMIGSNGYTIITDEELIIQYVKTLIFTDFNPMSYIDLPNEESTGILFKQELHDLLLGDPLLASLSLIPILNVYPTANESIGFDLILSDKQSISIDMSKTAFLQLRRGVLLGYGTYSLVNEIYDFNKPMTRFERINIKNTTDIIYLTHVAQSLNTINITTCADVIGFDENGIPMLPQKTFTSNINFDRYNTTINLADIFTDIEGYVANNVSIVDINGNEIDREAYHIINNYLIIDFLRTSYRGAAVLSVTFVKGASYVTKYTENKGIYFPEFAAQERTNIQYEVKLSEALPLGKYMVIYESYGVT